ncbi:zinc finger, CCHC-type containing protein [Tanacetum coccineum]|uniref:Zinc finger, CCHC-type containing protein n=1 Tax=Tanacetum coccineum TaxID=301880 RepID=A0ABQ4ZA30_9ASTR
MAAAAMKHMASNFTKLDKFEGVDFRRWQKKMHFLLSRISVVYVLTTPIPEDGGDDATVKQIRKRANWDNDDYVCRGLILNVMEQHNELLGILGRFTQHKMNMDEAIRVPCIIDKLPPSWKDFKHTLKHKKEELSLVELGSHLRIEESLRAQDSDKPKGNNVVGPQEAIFDENRFPSVPRPSLKIPNGTKDIGGSGSLKRSLKRLFNNLNLSLEKAKGIGLQKDFGLEFQLYLIEGTRDEVMGEYNYFDTSPVARISTIRLLIAMTSIHNLIIHQMDVKTAFLNGDLDEEVYMNQPQGFIMPGNKNKVCKLIKSLSRLKQAPKQWHQKFDEVVLSNVQVDLTKEFLSSRFSMKDMEEADVILSIKIKHESNGITISRSHYIKKVLKKFNYFDCTLVSTPTDTNEKLMPNNGNLSSYKLKQARTCNTKDNSYYNGWVFLGMCISWLQEANLHKLVQHESVIVALAAAGKEVEWLKNLLLEIPLWSKPIASIFIHYDSAATLAKAYSQMYNGKSRHLGVRHSMIRELITNGEISIEFVRSQQNLANHLTKELARDLVIKSVEWMGLNGLKHMYLHIIPRMCLEPAEKEDEFANFLMVNFFEKMLSRSINKRNHLYWRNDIEAANGSSFLLDLHAAPTGRRFNAVEKD